MGLIKLRAEIEIEDPYGHTALTVAAQAANSDEVLKALIKARANINHQDKEGCTPLMYAASFGHPAEVKALILGRADLMLADPEGYTALKFAMEDGKLDVAAMLEQAMKKR